MHNTLNEDVRRHLAELERLCLAAGDHEIVQELRKILDSSDQIASLHSALTRKLGRRNQQDQSSRERHEFFSTFESPEGNRLNDDQVKDLVKVTTKWKLNDQDVKVLTICSLIWAEDPGKFWNGEEHGNDILRRLFHDLERMQDIEPTRRKILLVTFSREIGKEQHRANDNEPRRKRTNKAKNHVEHREKTHLTSSVRNIFSRLYPQLEDHTKKKKQNRFVAYSRCGWKWDQLKETEMILSLAEASVKSFERRAWEPIEFMAINKFLNTLPQYRIRHHLTRAWRSIINYYRDREANDKETVGHPIQQTNDYEGQREIQTTAVPRKRGLSSSNRSNKRQNRQERMDVDCGAVLQQGSCSETLNPRSEQCVLSGIDLLPPELRRETECLSRSEENRSSERGTDHTHRTSRLDSETSCNTQTVLISDIATESSTPEQWGVEQHDPGRQDNEAAGRYSIEDRTAEFSIHEHTENIESTCDSNSNPCHSQAHPATSPSNNIGPGGSMLPNRSDAPGYFNVFAYPSTDTFNVFDYSNPALFDVFEYPSVLDPEALENTVTDFIATIPSQGHD